jgi:hypothetical protein
LSTTVGRPRPLSPAFGPSMATRRVAPPFAVTGVKIPDLAPHEALRPRACSKVSKSPNQASKHAHTYITHKQPSPHHIKRMRTHVEEAFPPPWHTRTGGRSLAPSPTLPGPCDCVCLPSDPPRRRPVRAAGDSPSPIVRDHDLKLTFL